MYCSHCGYKLRDGSKFCSGCGAKVIASVEPRAANNDEKNISALLKQEETAPELPKQEYVAPVPQKQEEIAQQREVETPAPAEDLEAVKPSVEHVPELDIGAEYLGDDFDRISARNHFSKLGVGYMLYSVLAYITAKVIYTLLAYFAPNIYNNVPEIKVAVSIVAIYGIAFLVLLLFLRMIKPDPLAEKKKIGVGVWFLYLVIGIGVMGIGSQISSTLEMIIEMLTGRVWSEGVETLYDTGNPLITAAYAVIIAPIAEEFVFRRLIIDRTRKFGGPICIILSAAMFGLMHGNIGQAIPAFGAGLVLGYLYYKHGKLLPCALIHAGINLFSTVNTLIFDKIDLEFLSYPSIEGLWSNILWLMLILVDAMIISACMVVAVVIPIVMRKKISFDEPSIIIPRGQRFKTVILNAGAIMMFIAYFAEIISYYIIR